MQDYTVVGYYEDNNQRYVGHFKAATSEDACRDCSTMLTNQGIGLDLVIVDVFEGHHHGKLRGEHAQSATYF